MNEQNTFASAGPRNERRHWTRYSIEATACFEWQGADGDRRTATGQTRDICAGGAFIACPALPQVNSGIELLIYARLNWQPDTCIVLHGSGQVCDLRPEALSGPGFAVRGNFEIEIRSERECPEEGTPNRCTH